METLNYITIRCYISV